MLAKYIKRLKKYLKKRRQKRVEPAPQAPVNRRLKKPRYTSFKLEKPIRYTAPYTPGTIKVIKECFRIFKKNWRLIGGISLVYMVLYVLFVRGVGGGLDFAGIKQEISDTMSGVFSEGKVSNLTTVAGLVGMLLTNPAAGNPSNVASSFYQSVLFVVFVLALIWALRQIAGGHRVTTKDAFYKGMYPLVPFILIICVIAIQMIPVFFGSMMYQIMQDPDNPIALSLAEQVVAGLFWFMSFMASFYMVTGSVFALIVVTLAEMTPTQALRGAYDLVRFRRFIVMRRFFVFVVLLLIAMVAIMLPTLLWAVRFASFVYLLWTVFSVTMLVTFLYTMYRRMLPRG